MSSQVIRVGDVEIRPRIERGFLYSIGAVKINGTPVRNPATRFLPWFDTYEGDVFRRFRLEGIETKGTRTIITTTALSDPDAVFRERRDSSGDICFRNANWDAPPIEAQLKIVLAPARATIDGHKFSGFKYWFEYSSRKTPIHRFLDRQTWEVGGNLDDLTLCCRNWLTPPRMKIRRNTTYSTVGLDKWASLMPGNMWGRWSLLPAFDMQYGTRGVLVGWFDKVSNIRTAIETNRGENCLRCLDLHYFEQSRRVRTNPKTILHCPDRLDNTDALNLWTRLHDREHERACAQFGIPDDGPPAIIFSENVWKDMHFNTTYEHVVDVAAEFGADYVFIDPIWEHQEALRQELERIIPTEKRKGTIFEKLWHQNMCVTLDFEVADIIGGEARLKALCDRAAARGVGIISWMATHYSPNSTVSQRKELGRGRFGIFAAKESGSHPDTGYPASCWTANLNAPVADRIREQVIGVCQRTGLAGYLWDSFSNLGWWQVDYSDGTMRPQFDKMAQLFADIVNAGLYVMPEAITALSNHSCCGLHAGNIYPDDLLPFMYNSSIGPWYQGDTADYDQKFIKGNGSIDIFFRSVAHKRLPTFNLHRVPRDEWNARSVSALKELLRVYKDNRSLMKKRTVLKGDKGVLWENDSGEALFFCFKEQHHPGTFTDAATGETVDGKQLKANRVYRCRKADLI